MVWPFTSSDPPKTTNADPLRDLDPSLKAFLQKESPLRYDTPQAAPPPPAEPAPAPSPQPNEQDPASPDLTYSLYPDGRYAHLWTTYKPLREIEEEGKTDQERLRDIIDGFKLRRAQIGRAALENCAMEQSAVSDCYVDGGLARKMNLCRAENRAFDRCYVMQSRFLKALGYLAAYERPRQLDEDIQMHADSLYHRMLEQEDAVARAREEGRAVPVFPRLIDEHAPRGYRVPSAADYLPQSKLFRGMGPDPEEDARLRRELEATGGTKVAGEDYTVEEKMRLRGHLKPELLAKLDARLASLSPERREMEEHSQYREIESVLDQRKRMDSLFFSWNEAKRKRREEGKTTALDRFTEVFQWTK